MAANDNMPVVVPVFLKIVMVELDQLEVAISMAQSDDLIFVGGSTFTVAEVV